MGDPYHNPASTTFWAFMRMLGEGGGRLRTDNYTGQRSEVEDLKRETPSVESISPKF